MPTELPMTERRLDRIRDPRYLADLSERPSDSLRTMRDECGELETEASYLRRLAQGRIDILKAERSRRDAGEGGSLDRLIEDLPRILAGDLPRPDVAHSRVPARLDPPETEELGRDYPELVGDSTLANVPALTDAELAEACERYDRMEREISSVRRELHSVLHAIETELTRRIQAEG